MAKISKKKEIIQKSAQLFREKGYAASSVRDIAQAVGLEPSSLYSHIKSKEDLLFAICMECSSHYNNAIDEALAIKGDDIEKLKKCIEIHIDLALNDPTSSTVFSDEWKHLPKERLEKFLQEKKEYERKFLNHLDKLNTSKRIKNIDPYIIMNSMISSTRWLHYSKKKWSNEEKIKTKNHILEMLVDGILG
jgi:AcrR family transcriptional regulator